MLFIAFPVYQILKLLFINTGSYYILHFILFITFFRDMHWARPHSSVTDPCKSGTSQHWCHIHANSNISPICSDASPTNSDVSPTNSDVSPTNSDVSPIYSDVSPTNSDVSPICFDASPTNSDVSPPNSYSVPLVHPAHFCHTFRYIPCFLPVTYLSTCCYLLLPCVSPTLPFTCFVFITRILSFQLVYKSLCISSYLSTNINKAPSSSCFCLTLSSSSDSTPTPTPTPPPLS